MTTPDNTKHSHSRYKQWLINLSLWTIILYWWGAFFFDHPFGTNAQDNRIASIIWLACFAVGMFKLSHWWQRAILACFFALIVAIPWFNIKPSNDHDWDQGFEKTGFVTIDGDYYTFHNFRSFDYTLIEDGVTERWTTRTVQLSKLQD